MQDANDLDFGRIDPVVVDAVLDGRSKEDHVLEADGVSVSIPAVCIEIEYHTDRVQCHRHINAFIALGFGIPSSTIETRTEKVKHQRRGLTGILHIGKDLGDVAGATTDTVASKCADITDKYT